MPDSQTLEQCLHLPSLQGLEQNTIRKRVVHFVSACSVSVSMHVSFHVTDMCQ